MSDTFDKIKAIIRRVTGRRNITPETDLIKDLELSSIDVVNIVSAIEEAYDIDIPTRDIKKVHQVKDIIRYLNKRGIK